MEKIKDLITALKQDLHNTLTKDSTNEEVTRVEGFCNSLDVIDQRAGEIQQDKTEILEKYLKVIKNEGSTSNEDDGAGGEDKPVSLKDCIDAEIKKAEK